MIFKNELYPIHFYGRVRGKCDGRLQNWPGIVNERPKFLAMISGNMYRWHGRYISWKTLDKSRFPNGKEFFEFNRSSNGDTCKFHTVYS